MKMTNQLKQQELINTISLLTDEQIDILNQFIKSFVPNKTNTNHRKKDKEEFLGDSKYLISDLLIKDWSKPEEDEA